MTEDRNYINELDPCPDDELLEGYVTEAIQDELIEDNTRAHLEFCASCKTKVQKMLQEPGTREGMMKAQADRFRQRQAGLQREIEKGPVTGTIWRTITPSDEELLGPLVFVLESDEGPTGRIVKVAEVSEDIEQAIETDMVVEPYDSRLNFSCMIRAGNVFKTDANNLQTFAGRLSQELTIQAIVFCSSADSFDEDVPLAEYEFTKDSTGPKLMRRRGVTSGLPVTKSGDLRDLHLEEAKRICEYLRWESDGADGVEEAPMAAFVPIIPADDEDESD
jgi:hypothetical protein